MKFAETLGAHITPTWRKQYIEYEKMKEMLYEAQEGVPIAEDTDPEVIKRYFAKFHEEFFRFCDLELKKINIFFSEKLAEATRKLASLKSDMEQLKEKVSDNSAAKKSNAKKKVAFSAKTHHDLKLAFSEFYLSLVLIQNYQNLNFTGFRKILKKHDKLLETKSGAEWRQAHVETSQFYTSKDVDGAIEEVENIVTSDLESGDRGKAMKRLRVPPLGETQNPWTTFRFGLFLGLAIVLTTIAIITVFKMVDPLPVSWQMALRLYRWPMLVIIFFFLIGGNTYGWRTNGVNHILIFELDPRSHLTYQQFLEVGGFFAVVWGVSLILFLFSKQLGIPIFSNPLWMAAFLFLYFVDPFHILHYNSRSWLLNCLWKMAAAPFYHVEFKHFWMADQFNSLALVLLDIQYFICFYGWQVQWTGPQILNSIRAEAVCGNSTVACTADEGGYLNPCTGNGTITFDCIPVEDVCHTNIHGIRPLIAILPAWFRFAQCWRRYRDTRHAFPHVVNAFKYSTSFLTVTFSALSGYHNGSLAGDAFFWLWIISAVISSCYTFTWDIKMDWGLLDKNAGENRFLREETVYRYKWYYYLAMVQDLVLRFTWTITMTVSRVSELDDEVLKTVFAVLEVYRRFIWNFFRLENEHLNNCGEFRAVRDISVTPIDHSDQVLLEKMMDEEDGVMNRRDKANRKSSGLRKRDVSKSWILEEEDDEQTDTWTAFKGGLASWLSNRRSSNDRKNSSATLVKPKEG